MSSFARAYDSDSHTTGATLEHMRASPRPLTMLRKEKSPGLRTIYPTTPQDSTSSFLEIFRSTHKAEECSSATLGVHSKQQ
jgi:hypothetical protein